MVCQVRKPVFLLEEGVQIEQEMPAVGLSITYQGWLAFLVGSPSPSSVSFCSWWVLGQRLQDKLPALLGPDPTWGGYLLGSTAQWGDSLLLGSLAQVPPLAHSLLTLGIILLLEFPGLGCPSGT